MNLNETIKPKNDIFCLDDAYSTTRRVTTCQPAIENKPNDAYKTVLFLPEGEGRKGEGGLRTKGYFKKSQTDKPLVSVVTVVFNGEKYLAETILSVIGQSYDNVEYIIIDGGSTDRTLAILKKYEGQIDYWVSEEDDGLYDAMNKGIDLFLGEWIYFIGADDVLVRDSLRKMNFYKQRTNEVHYGDVYMPKKHQIYHGMFSNCKLMLMNICHQSIFYGKETINNKHFILNYKTFSDYAMNIRISGEAKFIYHPVLIAIYNDIDGISTYQKDFEFEKDKLKIIKAYHKKRYYILIYILTTAIKIFEKIRLKRFLKKLLLG